MAQVLTSLNHPTLSDDLMAGVALTRHGPYTNTRTVVFSVAVWKHLSIMCLAICRCLAIFRIIIGINVPALRFIFGATPWNTKFNAENTVSYFPVGRMDFSVFLVSSFPPWVNVYPRGYLVRVLDYTWPVEWLNIATSTEYLHDLTTCVYHSSKALNCKQA